MPDEPHLDPHVHSKGYSVANYIRPLALVVFRRDDGRILVAPGYDPVKQQRFYRPLGGGIDFMEPAVEAARREIREELNAEAADLKLIATFENIFTYLGQSGHELVWLYEGRFTDAGMYAQDVIIADESGHKFEVHWISLDTFSPTTPLYPDGLLDLLTERPASDVGYSTSDIQRRGYLMRIVLRDKRQITLPAEVCKELGLEPGSPLDLRVEGQQIVLEPSGRRVLDALEEISRALKEAGVTEEEWLEGGKTARNQLVRERWPHLFPKEGE